MKKFIRFIAVIIFTIGMFLWSVEIPSIKSSAVLFASGLVCVLLGGILYVVNLPQTK